MREAPSKTFIAAALAAGMKIQAYDPVAMVEASRRYAKHTNFSCCTSAENALMEADALVIVTDWDIFFNPNFELIKKRLKDPVIFDGRNLYDPHYLRQLNIKYYAIGRGEHF